MHGIISFHFASHHIISFRISYHILYHISHHTLSHRIVYDIHGEIVRWFVGPSAGLSIHVEASFDGWEEEESPTVRCLFCPVEAAGIPLALAHMLHVHGFAMRDYCRGGCGGWLIGWLFTRWILCLPLSLPPFDGRDDDAFLNNDSFGTMEP